ncbi:MAG: M20/M25/M40 family metallo-hydrolase [Nitrospinota bacterium]|nr:M20/M25/M40 family metallo-hydrolase [Nitrospinota bacterium]
MKTLKANLRRHVEALSVDIGQRHMWKEGSLDRAAEYIESQFTAIGHKPWRQTFSAYDKPVANIIAEWPGPPGPLLVIGAHYDTVPGSPGADDNTSAVAGLLELARLFQETQAPRPTTFAAFVNEESPCYGSAKMGSMRHASLLKEQRTEVELMVCLEMIGYFRKDQPQEYPIPGMGLIYPKFADFIAVTANPPSAWRAIKLTRGIRKGSDINARLLVAPEQIGGINRSDNYSYWKHGYRAVMVTDTANFRNRNYHQETDTIDTLDFDSMAEVVTGLHAALSRF